MREPSRHVRPLGRVCRRTPRRWQSSCRGDSRIAPTGTHTRPLYSLTPCQSDYPRNRSAIRVHSGSERLFRCSLGAPLGDFIGSASEESQLQKTGVPPFGSAHLRLLHPGQPTRAGRCKRNDNSRFLTLSSVARARRLWADHPPPLEADLLLHTHVDVAEAVVRVVPHVPQVRSIQRMLAAGHDRYFAARRQTK